MQTWQEHARILCADRILLCNRPCRYLEPALVRLSGCLALFSTATEEDILSIQVVVHLGPFNLSGLFGYPLILAFVT